MCNGIERRRQFNLARTADGNATGRALFKIIVAGFFPLARAFSNGQTNKSNNKEYKKKIFFITNKGNVFF